MMIYLDLPFNPQSAPFLFDWSIVCKKASKDEQSFSGEQNNVKLKSSIYRTWHDSIFEFRARIRHFEPEAG